MPPRKGWECLELAKWAANCRGWERNAQCQAALPDEEPYCCKKGLDG